jgi:hypothetical protein
VPGAWNLTIHSKQRRGGSASLGGLGTCIVPRADGCSNADSRTRRSAHRPSRTPSKDFGSRLEALLNEHGVEVPQQEPNMMQVLRDLGLDSRYHFYRLASQRQHGALLGLDAYTRHLGTGRTYGYFAPMYDWLQPLTMAMGSLKVLASLFLARTDARPDVFLVAEAERGWEEALESLQEELGPTRRTRSIAQSVHMRRLCS